ncbi:hypothetical protein NLJ89_g2603 [Agrocybe chaxingu]|uniref:Carboxylic ester hydrolase n=1 Tax=Agrocybe chaxingu TaxID=84603 RepID=A0A9W8K5K6_9AGAR|nr:hypothetical protein NLJ89_g2603 [Agrocybe chaxingu]
MLFECFKPLLLSAFLASQILAQSTPPPTTLVNLSYGSFEGQESGNLVEFLGLPYAAPPVGKLRFEPPTDPIAFEGIRQATAFAPACPQREADLTGGLPIPRAANISEDCLYLNVLKPANIPEGEKLPVLVYIHGSGFILGHTGQARGDTLVRRSVELGAPVILVTTAYRLNAFGFLGGKEIKAAGLGNIGIRDQRFALQWVQKHIEQFGGNPKNVKIWGVSAGAISVAMHMLLNDGNQDNLFHGGVMEAGSPLVLPDIVNQQRHFDALVAHTNCTDAPDRLECLRDAPYEALVEGVKNSSTIPSFEGLKLTWQPMVDGNVIVRDPQLSVKMGKFSDIPIITGCAEDEGTLFSLIMTNITNNAEFLAYVKSNYFNEISDKDLKALEIAYPDDVTQGSPFNTGTANVFSPQYKRLAAFQGDLAFQATRRSFSAIASKRQPVYGFRYMRRRLDAAPHLGVDHGSDFPEFMALVNSTGLIAADALIYFTRNGDPNAPQDSISLLRNTKWDVYSSSVENPPLFTFVDPPPSVNITFDTYRADAMKLLNKLSLKEIGRFGL